MYWEKEDIVKHLTYIKSKGFISIPIGMYRKDDGIVGQILEKEFDLHENNLPIADLGTYELKGMRLNKKKSQTLTLFHQKPISGLTPIEIFDRFSYIRPSNRSGIMKKKLFTTIYGNRFNSLGFILKANGENIVDLFHHDEYLSTWDLSSGMKKIDKVILALAETQGQINSKSEKFHYVKAFLLSSPKELSTAISKGIIKMDLCIDQPLDSSKAPHDRGPHIRISIAKLNGFFNNIEVLL